MKSLNKTEKIIFLVNLAFCLFGLIYSVVQVVRNPINTAFLIKNLLIILGYLAIAYYVFYAYKKPHGNSLKHIMIFVAIIMVLIACTHPALTTINLKAGAPPTSEAVSGEAQGDPSGMPEGEEPTASTGELSAKNGQPAEPEDQKSLIDFKYSRALEYAIIFFTVMILAYVAGRLNRVEQNRYYLVAAIIMLLARCFLDYYPGKYPVNANEFNMCVAIVSAYLVRYRQHKEAGVEID